MFSESDEDEAYTVHEVTKQDASQGQTSPPSKPNEQQEIQPDEVATASPLARYYRLGTQQRHAFDEHMRRLQEEAQRREQEREFRRQHPFRPHRETTTITSSLTDALHEGPAASLSVAAKEQLNTENVVNTAAAPVKPVFDRLAAQAVQLEIRRRHREEQQRRAEAAALRDAFQPEINRSAPVYAEQLRHLDDVPVETRLLHYGETVARERQRRQEMKALEEKAALQAAQASVVGARPVDPQERERLRADFEARNERFLTAKAQHRAKAEEEAAEAFSFQPQISATSAALDEARQRELVETRKAELQKLLSESTVGGSFSVQSQNVSGQRDGSRRSDALYAQAVARQRQQSQPQSRQHQLKKSGASLVSATKKEDSAVEEPTYQPRTNPTSDKWIASGPHRHFFEESFVRRQALYEQVKEEEATLKAAAVSAQEKQSAQSRPGLGGTSSEPGENAALPRPKVSTRELNERLYYNAQRASEVAQRRRTASVNAQECPFRPELSPGTQFVLQRMKLTRDGDVVKRLTGTPAHGKREVDPEKEDLYAALPSAATQQSARSKSTSKLNSHSPDEAAATAATEATADMQPSATPSPRKRPLLTKDQLEKFYQRQADFLQSRQDLIQERKDGEAMQELVECTFRPRTNVDRRDGGAASRRSESAPAGEDGSGASLTNVTGVAGFLERQMLARRRKAEHAELVRRMGLPRQPSVNHAHTSSGTTLLSPFNLQTSERRRRSSCSPLRERLSDSGEADTSSPVWVNALTSSERLLYDALTEAEAYPASSKAPLLPLPGYYAPSARERDGEEEEEDAVYFDEEGNTYTGMSSAEAYEEEYGMMMPRPSSLQVRPTRRNERVAVHGPDKPSLFSSLSPNTFSGRTLGAAATGGERRETTAQNPSALKGASAAALTSSAQRRKQKRSVSFVVDRASPPPRSGRASAKKPTHSDPAHKVAL